MTENAAESTEGSSFLLRHWRGELPLGQAFWNNTLLLNIALGIFLNFAVPGLLYDGYGNQIVLMVVTVAWMICLPIWQVVGVWRSAQAYKKQRKAVTKAPAFARLVEGVFWAYLAQFLCLVLVYWVVMFLPRVTPSWLWLLIGPSPFRLIDVLLGWLYL